MGGDQEGDCLGGLVAGGCGSTRPVEDYGPAHHERLSRRNVGGGGCLYWRGEGWGRLSGEADMPLEVWIIFMALVVAAVVLLPRILPPTGPTCTRCEGSGQRE